VYEDWYPVADWAALGALNDAAVSGARRAPHDAVAALARDGHGGVYRLLHGEPAFAAVRYAAWLPKPRETSYAELRAGLEEAAGSAAVWQRQMVLGPAPEFAVLAAEPVALAWPAAQTDPRPV
jgi:hypothetical protein